MKESKFPPHQDLIFRARVILPSESIIITVSVSVPVPMRKHRTEISVSKVPEPFVSKPIPIRHLLSAVILQMRIRGSRSIPVMLRSS